jgi:hypothetical protein
MAKRKRTTTEATITRRIKEGYGQGNGAAYRPWLSVQDVPSQGLVHRIQGWKTERVHHLFSNLERDYFYILEWSSSVLDIREQYPLLPPEETQRIAEQIGVRHPVNPKTQYPIVMTTDFVVDVECNGERIQQARTVKPAAKLEGQRTLEKLEIERLYWQAHGSDWGIVTEREIPKTFANNIRLLHGYRMVNDRLSGTINLSAVAEELLRVQGSRSIGDLAQYGDALFNLPTGSSLTILYHLLATQRIQADLFYPLTLETQLALEAEVLA